MDGGLLVMILFAIGIGIALVVTLLTIVFRQIRNGEIRWWR